MSTKRSQLMNQHITSVTMQTLQTVPFSKLSIKQICDIADINRNTFYRHFHDKYDLMNAILSVTFKQFFEHVDLDTFKASPFSILQDLQMNQYIDILDFQLQDTEFKKIFDAAVFKHLFKLSDDPEFIWTLGEIYVVSIWNQQRKHPYDKADGYRILDEIIRTKRFPTD
ncbi:TetR/AcrR family transcriptional regulator [Convivina praedatoris]|uniref:HTH tetR-type domain-containing protein n=1 Tax=Convivina praedatoris TaxID=2880963 RepID=A0ABN8HDV8_9LACO|nr:TetR/AcrR family transcriptional regulator [Convivina sp. LMG 32447]CAH1856074.1 hypothetical protein R078138_01264 [Convivina sp. LMG 32447]CAH1856325.1 hypothetical protein R077815_01378 [Convivina sp. LMG 32447]CAH1857070.1 hypothetical protein LMG032447_01433 [Convivina sp. LMG 32447]